MRLAWVLIFLSIAAGILYFYFASKKRPALQKPSLPSQAPTQELPARYGKDQIVALVKDPYWLYVYWEVTPEKRAEFDRRYGSGAWEMSQPLLRVYDLTGTTYTYDFLRAPYFEIAITELADNWYIYVGKPRSTFCIDLGRYHPQHGFIILARSNTVTTPADQPSEVIDPLWPPIEACWHGAGLERAHLLSMSSPSLSQPRR